MADEDVSSLVPIEDGELAKAKPLRQNFKYLDDKITSQATSISNKESLSRKGAPNGYCPLDSSGKVPSTYLTLILGALYRVGSIYITTEVSDTCPIASLIPGSTWEKAGEGRVLQCADSNHAPNTTIPAGLPNIFGRMTTRAQAGGGYGAFYADGGDASGRYKLEAGWGEMWYFSAQASNSTYGSSSTVQPPAYVVIAWRRTA